MKRCACCKAEKALDEFCVSKHGKHGRHTYCRECMKEKRRSISRERMQGYQNKWRAANREQLREKARSRYAENPDLGRSKSKRYRERHRDRLKDEWAAARRIARLASYGLSPEGYEQLLTAQGRCCAICKGTDPGHWSGKFQIDHDHATGAVRGLLCSGCNTGLGLFKDNRVNLAAAIEYLNRAESQLTKRIRAAETRSMLTVQSCSASR